MQPGFLQVEEYAEWLGMDAWSKGVPVLAGNEHHGKHSKDLEKDRDLFWIARAGLKAPLPGTAPYSWFNVHFYRP